MASSVTPPKSSSYLPDPPFVVTVQGPRDSGKSTLIRSLIYHYTRQKLSSVEGTISLRTSKTTRLTFYECPPDIASMVDLAKVTDLAVLVIDASVGFEMQTFQFLNLLQHHGFPACLGVLTRLDHYKDNKRQRKLKNSMKRRFWKEVGDGVKLFYLSGVASSQAASPMYKSHEVHNLARYLSIIKRVPLEWRQTHPYVLIDRYVPLASSLLTQTVHFYGYVRGTALKTSSQLHFTGLGDYSIKQVTRMDDPVPILDTRSSQQQQRKMKRALNLKERALYAPQAKLTTLAVDSQSVTIPDNYVVFTRITDAQEKLVNPTDEPGVKMVRALQSGDQKLGQETSDIKAELLQGIEFEAQERKRKTKDWKEEVKIETVSYSVDPVRALTHLIYQGEHFQTREPENYEEYDHFNSVDTFRVGDQFGFSLSGKERAYFAKKRCVTSQKLPGDQESQEEEELRQLVGKIEENEEEKEEEEAWKTNEQRRQEKEKAREEDGRFDFLNEEYGYLPKGAYVKCELEIEKKYVQKFESGDVMVLCGSESRENRLGLLRVKVKKHRWYPTILKNQDPLIISAGWRRFQTQPTYVTQDANGRRRMIKYTPKYGWCFGVFQAPLFPVKTPFVAFKSLNEQQDSPHF